MIQLLKKWFVPSRLNNHEPHFLRAWPVVILLVVIMVFFGAAQFLERSLTSADSYLAAVVASVLVDLTNFDRAQEGLHGLAVNQTLTQAAQLKANDMAARSYFAHNAPDGKTPWFWMGEAGYNFSYAGENLAVFFGDSEDVARAWMNSPSHRANILNSSFTEIGIATAQGVYQGRSTVFVVQMFGTPAVINRPVATLETQPVATEPSDPNGEVGGETIEVITEEDVVPTEEVSILHEDETFIAVKNNAPVAPSANSVESQSNIWERLIASPYTMLSYVYGVLGAFVAVALVLLVFLEIRVQKPKNIVLGVLLLIIIGALSYISFTDVVVASVEKLSAAVESVS